MATRSGLERWYPEAGNRFGTVTVFDLLMDYLKEGRIRVDKSRLKVRAAYHDPCNYGRKSEMLFGRGYYDEPRWILDQCLENWVDLYPNRRNQICCGGGGGALITGFDEERKQCGRQKMEQIRASKAEMVVVPCHSCHGQINNLKEEYGLEHLQVKYLWEIVADTLVMEGS